MKTNILLISILLISSSLFAQDLAEKRKDCSEFHLEACVEVREAYKKDKEESEINDREMKFDTQSKSALFSKGDTAVMKMRAYADQEYRLTFCAEEIFGGEAIEYKIYERKRVLIDWKSYDDSVKAVREKEYRLDSIKQDSIWNAASETEYEYYDNSEEDDQYDNFSAPYDDVYLDNTYDDKSYIETSRKRPKFKLVKELKYDNTKDDMSSTISFAAKETMSMIIEIIVPGDAPQNNFKLEERGCLGVLVEHSRITDTGF